MEAGEEGEALNPNVRARHIKKRALRNKGLSIGFNDKDLKDFVSGFHKRKKKRRQEAQRQLQEKERRKRIERRKQRKLEKELALFGAVSSENAVGSSSELVDDAEDEPEQATSVSGTKMYENGATTITVTTMELSRIDEDDDVPDVSSLGGDSEKDLHTSEKKSLKKAAKPTRKKPFMKAKPKSFKKHKKSASKHKRKNIRRNKQ
ncbi:hypothetical protein H6P81_000473 [Aristolochia fimbriata]|uniref:Ribosomal RNA-processing protein 17 n=1 Tax=Aristolochia fimbriata TaxID=158543 RepID=A0AAV7F6R6_ARIFI|nr:hypothetical protein H6P81_000473 [Aristolochia fimbriata]